MEVEESKDEILSDIIIFDENQYHENYVIVVELIPENPLDLAKLSDNHFEILSMTLYTFVEFDVMEIPFSEVDSYVCLDSTFTGDHNGQSDTDSGRELLFKAYFPKMGNYEIRVEGDPRSDYSLFTFKY